jgi:O-6-methylguanine DNA methyltransferase
MVNRRPEAACSRSCRLGPFWVAVACRDGKVSRVTLGSRGKTDDRRLARDLDRVLAGGRAPDYLRFDTSPLSGFDRKVLDKCAEIGSGEVMTYAELAGAAGRPKAARAVGQAMANNPFALLVPCHRVVGSDHSLHGFGGGLAMKEWLLAREGWQFEGAGGKRRLKSEGKGQKPKVKTGTRKGTSR